MCAWLLRIYEIMKDGNLFFTDDEAINFQFAIYRFLSHYVWLSKYSLEQGYLLWNIVPKMHYLCHVALQAAFCTPRFVHNYKEESFVGRLVKIYASCAKGRYHAVVQKTCLRKWVVGFSILLADLEAGL